MRNALAVEIFTFVCLAKSWIVIAFDDFLNRSFYHIVLEYFDIVEKTKDNSMVILKKKINVNITQEVIDKYELIQD